MKKTIKTMTTLRRPEEFVVTPRGVNVKRQRGISLTTHDEMANSLFGRLRESIKETGKVGMFLYGLPSKNVTALLLRVYNENILRNGVDDKLGYSNIKLMIGVAEVGGELYITFSEDPREDPDYAKKVKLLYTLLSNSNCNVEYPERDDYIRQSGRNDLAIKPSDLFPTTRIGFGYQISDTSRRIRQVAWKQSGDLLITENNESYITGLSLPLRVNFIHSIEYLLQRRPGDSIRGSPNYNPSSVMYPPFKRPQDLTSDGQPTGLYTCNNGSTCSESKMFAYLHNMENFNFAQISGYAAFWLGNQLPPNHIITGYNYTQDAPLFNEIRDVIKPIIDTITTSTDYKVNNFIQLFALPCPGCFSNYRQYTGNVKHIVDTSNCLHINRYDQIGRKKFRLLVAASVGGTIRSRRSRRNSSRRNSSRRNSSRRSGRRRATRKRNTSRRART